MRPWALAVAIAALLAAACGPSSSNDELATGDDALAALADGAESTLDAGTFRVVFSSAPTDECDPFADVSMEGTLDATTEALRVDEMPFDAPGEVVVTADTTYVAADSLPQGDRPSTPWLAFDAQDGDHLPLFVLWAPIGDTLDPRGMLDAMAELATSVEQTGTDTIDGEPVTVFHVTFDRERYNEQIFEVGGPAPDSMLEGIGAEQAMEFPVPVADVWVDGDGRVRRIDQWTPIEELERFNDLIFESLPQPLQDMPDGASMDLGTMELHSIVDLSDFGEPDPVEVPDADQVTYARDVGIDLVELQEAMNVELEPPPGCPDLDLTEGVEGVPPDVVIPPLGLDPGIPLLDEVVTCLEQVPVGPGADTVDPGDLFDEPDITGCLSPEAASAVDCLGGLMSLFIPTPGGTYDDALACVPDMYDDDVRCMSAMTARIGTVFGDDSGSAISEPPPPECENL